MQIDKHQRIDAFSLDRFVAHSGVTVKRLWDGSIEIATRTEQWGHSVNFPIRPEALQELGHDRSMLIIVTLTTQIGRVGIACLEERTGKFSTKEVFVSPDDRDTELELFTENVDEGVLLVVRNTTPGNHQSKATLHAIQTLPGKALTIGQRRQLAARNFPYWHYEHDLGHGAKTEPNHPDIMKWHALRHRMVFDFINERFGPSLVGKHCIDFGCCSGWWSFSLADRGASRIVALDKNAQYIEQAKFVQSCSENPNHRRIEFLHEDILSYEAEPQGFDIALCLGLMYHLTDLVGAAACVFRATRNLAIIDSAISSSSGALLELADWKKYSFCSENEFAFVPTRDALIGILNYVGFSRVVPCSLADEESETAYGLGKNRILILAER